jgi:hypothetical protein
MNLLYSNFFYNYDDKLMKKLLLTSLLMLCASLSYAGSGCGGGGCDTDKKDKAPKADFTKSSTILAGAGCGDKCGDKKDGKSDFTVRQAAIV